MKKIIAICLAAMLVMVAPMTAFAFDDPNHDTVSVSTGETFIENATDGTVTSNSGIVKTNNGAVTTNEESGKIGYLNTVACISYEKEGKTVAGIFYFDKSGNMVTGWQKIDDVWYYFDTTTGAMLMNTTTPDGYKVDAEGKYVK